MPRNDGHRMGAKVAQKTMLGTAQKGRKRRGIGGLSTYAKMAKSRNADRYTRPYLTNEWKEWHR